MGLLFSWRRFFSLVRGQLLRCGSWLVGSLVLLVVLVTFVRLLLLCSAVVLVVVVVTLLLVVGREVITRRWAVRWCNFAPR